MADADLAEVGLYSGLAIHRQLLTKKLLCCSRVQAKTKLEAERSGNT
jgi:Glu-tRNA(Gln) amidotransferase subunit E-like FAD-binding protein